MSWLGESFNSLTGQITNFTREVLTEGTEEVDDHAAELSLKKGQVEELKNHCQILRQEVDRLKNLNSELEEKAQSSEIQVHSISSEYRSLLHEKESELNALKQKLCDRQIQPVDSSLCSTPAIATPFGQISANESQDLNFTGQSDYFDFDDVIHSDDNKHHDEKFKSYYENVSTNCASGDENTRKHGNSDFGSIGPNGELQNHIKELESKLLLEVDQHQCELTALQDFHQEKFIKLKEQYEEEVSLLKSELSITKDKLCPSAESDDFKQNLIENKSEIENLKKKLDALNEDLGAKYKDVQLLNRQLDQVQKEKADLESRLETVLKSCDQNHVSKEEIPTKKSKDDIPDFKDQLSIKNAENSKCDISVQTETDFMDEKSKKEEISILQQKLDESLSNICQLNDDLSEKCNKLDELKQENISLKEDNQNFNSILKENKRNIDTFVSKNELLSKNIEELNKQHQEAMDQVMIAKNELYKSNLELQQQLVELNKKIETVSNKSFIEFSDLEKKFHELPRILEKILPSIEKDCDNKISINSALNVVVNNLKLNYKNFTELEEKHRILEERIMSLTEGVNEQTSNFNEKIESYVRKIKSLEEDIKTSTEKIEIFKATISDIEIQNTQLEESLTTLQKENEGLKSENKILEKFKEHFQHASVKSPFDDSTDLQTEYVDGRDPSQISDGSSGVSDFEIVKDDGSDRSTSSKEFVQVEHKEKEDVCEVTSSDQDRDQQIKILQDKVLMLSQQLLDCTSVSEDAGILNQTPLEEQIKQLKYEKEQIMAVMNEKMQECSALKTEVHQLMKVVSVEKQAIGKLQRDNEDLLKSQKESSDPELTKETIHKLSNLIRDKDVEIEALIEKNQSLTNLLKSEPDHDNNEFKVLLEERESLQKQLAAYKSDREQILSALNQKHQESLNFHSELQKVRGLLSEENEKYDDLHIKHQSVSEQFEAKQKSLVNTQNELILIKQKFEELKNDQLELRQQYSTLINKESDDGFVHVNKELWTTKNEECFKLKSIVEGHEKLISEKDILLHESSKNLKELEDMIEKKNHELHLSKVHNESLNVKLKGIQEELQESLTLNESNINAKENFKSECDTLRALNTKLGTSLKEKEFEINSLQSNLEAFKSIAEKAGSDENSLNENLKKLLEENQQIASKAQSFQQERDQTLLALRHEEQKNVELRNELIRCNEKENRLMKELERLRIHLVKVEESYTNEAIYAEEREKELRNRLASAEEQVRSNANSFNSVNQRAVQQVDSLQEQLHAIAKQRDDALLQLSNSESQVMHYSSSLNNLQLVLEQFQQEKKRDMDSIIKKCNMLIEEEKKRTNSLKADLESCEMRLKEKMEALSAASRLSEQLDKKEEIIGSLRAQVTHKDMQLQTTLKEIQNFTSNSSGKVDKQILKNLFLGYFTTPNDKKHEVIRLLAGVLDFNQEEVGKMQAVHGNQGKKGSWLSWLSRTEGSSQQHPPTVVNDSFSEAFVQFLQKESQPQIQVKLPAEEMAKELTLKTKNPLAESSNLKPLRINPFTASVSQSSPTQKSSSHLLMKPISAALPTFAPLPVADTSNSSTILKDVLQEE